MRILRSLLLLAAVIAVCTAQAQRQGFQLSLGGGGGLTRLHNHNLDRYNIHHDPGSFLVGGGAIGLMFSHHVGFFAGLEYDYFKWRYDYASGLSADTVDGVIRQGFLTVPMYFRFVSSGPERPGAFLQIGLKIGFLTSITDTWHKNGREYFNTRRDGYATTPLFPFLAAGIVVPVATGVVLQIGPAFQYQSSNNFYASDSTGHVLSGHLVSAALRAAVNVRINP